MGGQRGGMVNERGRFPEVCQKSIQAMAADMQGAIPDRFFEEVSLTGMRTMSPRELEAMGRLTVPLHKGPLDTHYRPVTWDAALERVTAAIRAADPDETFYYFSGRSSNEAGFLLQLLARMTGTNHVHNCSFYCHQASGVALSGVTGSGTATVVLEDLEEADLIVLIGANPASNHPRFMRTLLDLKRRGGRVIVINPLREAGLVRFKVPSDVRSLLFGSTIADLYLQPRIGGDIALLTGIARDLLDRDAIDPAFIESATSGWSDWRDRLEGASWSSIEAASGLDRGRIREAAEIIAASRGTIYAWAMGITHHVHGVNNVRAIANLALMRGMVGRRGAGLLPLRGHSNIQGIGSVGVTPKLKQAIFDGLRTRFGLDLPTAPGLDTMGCIERAAAGRMRLAVCLGGNLYGSNPDAAAAAAALQSIDLTVSLSTALNTGHAWGAGRESIILPVLARDEEPDRTTQESMFNYVRFSDGGRPRHAGPRSEVEVIATLGRRLFGTDGPIDWATMAETGSIRRLIGAVVPGYGAIDQPNESPREFQIEGRTFHTPVFATPDGRARFHDVVLPEAPPLGPRALRLMTIRSEGQFNTVVYEEEDVYRGQTRRDVIMLHPTDMERLGLSEDQSVRVSSNGRMLEGWRVRPIDVARGCAVAYYPEANTLIAQEVDPESGTPGFKHAVVTIDPMD